MPCLSLVVLTHIVFYSINTEKYILSVSWLRQSLTCYRLTLRCSSSLFSLGKKKFFLEVIKIIRVSNYVFFLDMEKLTLYTLWCLFLGPFLLPCDLWNYIRNQKNGNFHSFFSMRQCFYRK